MPTANFYLKSGGTIPERLIYLFFSYNGYRLKYSTGHKIPTVFWNEEKQRARETNKYPQHSELNARLGNLAKEAERLHLKGLNSGRILAPDELRAGLDIFRGKAQHAPQRGLFAFIENFIQERTASPKFKEGSIKQYRNLFNKLKEFARSKHKQRFDFRDITPEFWEQYRDFLYAQNLAENTVHKQLRILKTILADATEKGATGEVEVYRNTKRLGVKAEPVQKIYLSLAELEIFFHLELTENYRLARVRDLFLIGAFTGLRFSDFTQIRPEHFNVIDGVEVLEIDTEKTGERVVIPVHTYGRAILQRNGGQPPRGISNQKMNDYLKELGSWPDSLNRSSLPKK
ncbi:MAG: site-specific integrase [Saprospirales bacterium]|nr:site-specific integrase [Saprospirales bacterium]